MSSTPDYITRLKEIVEEQTEYLEEEYRYGQERSVESYVHAFLSLLTFPEEFIQPDVVSPSGPDRDGEFGYEWIGDQYRISVWWTAGGRLGLAATDFKKKQL